MKFSTISDSSPEEHYSHCVHRAFVYLGRKRDCHPHWSIITNRLHLYTHWWYKHIQHIIGHVNGSSYDVFRVHSQWLTASNVVLSTPLINMLKFCGFTYTSSCKSLYVALIKACVHMLNGHIHISMARGHVRYTILHMPHGRRYHHTTMHHIRCICST